MRFVIHNHLPVRTLDSYREFPEAYAQATSIDPLGYLKGLTKLTFVGDIDQWNAAYIADSDEIVIEKKFHAKTFMDKVQTLLHEGGHRGQYKMDPETYKTFKATGLATVSNFFTMANRVHRQDFVKNGIEDHAEEAFAESYARFALGLEMPEEIRKFWTQRVQHGHDARRSYDPSHREYTGNEPVASAIKNHPGVQEATISGDSDYKYEVFLKEGWSWQSGRNAGGRTGFFHNVGEFRQANPIRSRQ